MKTALVSPLPAASSSAPALSLTGASSPRVPERPGVGRPTELNAGMIDLLCSIIRETRASDSAAAARAGLHPSTVSRWKRDCPDFAILLRSAREDYRGAQLAIIQAEVQTGRAEWRAAAWLLERTFPEDYSPRAKERAAFQERFDAVCASELEGHEIALPHREEPLQNVQDSALLQPPAEICHEGKSLQNVQNSAPAPAGVGGLDGPARPLEGGAARTGSIHVEGHASHFAGPAAAPGERGAKARDPRGLCVA